MHGTCRPHVPHGHRFVRFMMYPSLRALNFDFAIFDLNYIVSFKIVFVKYYFHSNLQNPCFIKHFKRWRYRFKFWNF